MTAQPVTVTVSVSQTNGPVAGFYLTTAESNGTFQAIEAGTALNGAGVTHTMPRTGSGGVTTFRAQWSPGASTGVQFLAYAVSANNNGAPTGDGAGTAQLSLAIGCAGITLYLDQDADGYGTADPAYPTRKDCGPKIGYATVAGDCDDFNPLVHPGAPEMCDGKDNNCNGQVDENVTYQAYCQDQDGDGHGVAGAKMKMDCAPTPGFGDCAGDCDDLNPAIHPGAAEVCDGRDNNCDGAIDEGVRPSCGVGWCRRIAPACNVACTPGPPRAEQCNLFDDDCDGVIDNGTDAELCGASGLVCVGGMCVPQGSGSGGASGGADGGVGSASADARTGAAGAAGVAGASGSNSIGGGCTLADVDVGVGVGVGGRRSTSGLAAIAMLIGALSIKRRARRPGAVRRR